MNHDDFVLTEYTQLYELVRHYANVQHNFFQMFMTAFAAVCAGYFTLETSTELRVLSDKLLILGFIANQCFLALLVSNRAYFQINFRKIEFLRQRFLYTNQQAWAGYPLFNVSANNKQAHGDEYKSMRWHSAFFLRIIIVSVASSILFYLMRFPEASKIIADYKLLMTLVLFVLLLALSSLFTKWKEGKTEGVYEAKQE